MNLPSSSHFVTRTMPEPSQTINFIRSARFDRKTKISPQKESACNALATLATRPCTPTRKPIGCDATSTFTSPRGPINLAPMLAQRRHVDFRFEHRNLLHHFHRMKHFDIAFCHNTLAAFCKGNLTKRPGMARCRDS
jgi:hypothetical protein